MDTIWEPRIARRARRNLEDFYDKTVSQIELARWLGYSRSAIQNWEAGRATPDPAMRFMYHKLVQEPGFIAEIRLWSESNGTSKQQTSQSAAS
jgi:DNA-binding XRE family transcriptional regulator|tara:strand:- start:298 stop:576 length:279 start_codon:yes stop_codon:yes gene_type:complete